MTFFNKNMYELEQKNYALISKKCNDYRLMSILCSLIHKKEPFKLYDISLSWNDTFNLYAYLYSKPRFKKIIKTNNRNYQRMYRIRKRVNNIVFNEFDSYFLTFTFENKYINDDFNKNKRRVIRYLKNNCIDYVANADIGKKKKRLHFHCVCNTDKIDLVNFKYGYLDKRFIKNKNAYKISNYIDKLVNHSIKDTTYNFKVFSNRLTK